MQGFLPVATAWYYGQMDAEILACSGPDAVRIIYEAQIYARSVLAVSAAIVAFAVIVAWLMPPALVRSVLMLFALAVHPALWGDGMSGDCGTTLRTWSTIWTGVTALAACAVLAVPLWRKPTGLPTSPSA